MRQLVDIHDVLETDSLNDFRDELVRLGAHDPDLCERLLGWILQNSFNRSGRSPFEKLLNDEDRQELHRPTLWALFGRHEDPLTRRFSDVSTFFTHRRGGHSDTRSDNKSNSSVVNRSIQRFIERCKAQRHEACGHVDSHLEDSVKQLYANGAAEAIKYLLDRSDAETLRMFSDRYLDTESLARQATVRVVVRKADESVTITGNTGRFLVFLRFANKKDVRLSFTNQASMVYYLMFLIHHYLNPYCKSPVSLSANREEFMRLYHRVYQISEEKLEERVYHLLYREVDGNLRVGRENELRRDIRHHLEDLFSNFGGSHQPYAMTARTHLTVPRELLIFEGEAEELLHFCFI